MHYQPRCLNNQHRSKKVCISPTCNIKNPFVCQQCENKHSQNCEVILYKQLIKRLHAMQGLRKGNLVKYEQYVQNTFSTLMKSLQSQFVKFRELFQHINANDTIKLFYQQLKSHKQFSLSGSWIHQMLQQTFPLRNNYKLKSQAIMWTLGGQLAELQKKVNKKLPYYYSLYDDVVQQNLQLQKSDPIKQVQEQFRQYRQHLIGGLLQNQINKIESLLDKEIYNIQILYRASKHQYSAKTFHQICDGKKNTLVVAKTQYGNIVGGFSSVPWRSPSKWQYEEDPYNLTFIFSLGKYFEGLKFSPFKKKFTIGMHRQYGPCFGDDLVIYDKSNTSKNCWSNFPDCYVCNQKQILHNQKTIREFVGVDDHFKKFNIVQWQVYKISFNRSEQLQRSFMQEYRKI